MLVDTIASPGLCVEAAHPGAGHASANTAAPASASPGAKSEQSASQVKSESLSSSAPGGASSRKQQEGSGASSDGWPDASDFLDEKYGFLPIVMPITEPAVGYGAGGGLMFLSAPLAAARDGLGRPSVTFAGGLGTENGTWGVGGGDMRYWDDDHLQTLVAVAYASVNLDFYGVGKTDALQNNPLRYNLRPILAMVQGKYRFGSSLFWAGLRYAFNQTKVTFDAPAETPNLPDYENNVRVGGLAASATFDSRDNIFTPIHGTYLDGTFSLYAPWLGGQATFERVDVTVLQYFPLPFGLYLGLRGEGAASFADTPFYMRPFIDMRGVPKMRYQGQEIAQIEAELRWQFYGRLSVLGFGGGGGAWNHFEKFDSDQGIGAGGVGLRYEIARQYGIHMGVDVGFSRDTTAVYVQVGSAWSRP